MSAAGPTTGSGGGTDLDSLTEIRLRIAASPHLRSSHSTPRIMWNVLTQSSTPVAAASIGLGQFAQQLHISFAIVSKEKVGTLDHSAGSRNTTHFRSRKSSVTV